MKVTSGLLALASIGSVFGETTRLQGLFQVPEAQLLTLNVTVNPENPEDGFKLVALKTADGATDQTPVSDLDLITPHVNTTIAAKKIDDKLQVFYSMEDGSIVSLTQDGDKTVTKLREAKEGKVAYPLTVDSDNLYWVETVESKHTVYTVKTDATPETNPTEAGSFEMNNSIVSISFIPAAEGVENRSILVLSNVTDKPEQEFYKVEFNTSSNTSSVALWTESTERILEDEAADATDTYSGAISTGDFDVQRITTAGSLTKKTYQAAPTSPPTVPTSPPNDWRGWASVVSRNSASRSVVR